MEKKNDKDVPEPEMAAEPQKELKKEPQKELKKKEIGGPKGPEPTRYGDWERKGIVSDF